MIVTRTSVYSGTERKMDLPVNPEQLALIAAPGGPLIQDALPHLTPDQREFLMTGVTPEEWDELFGDDE